MRGLGFLRGTEGSIVRKIIALAFTSLILVACQTTEAERRAQLQMAKDDIAERDGEKQSLDKMLDEHDRVTLLDDDTGKEKLICRRIKPQIGTRLGARKVCATKKQWADSKQQSQDEINDFQRKMTLGGKSN